jgi:hypothetical protein
MSRPYTDTLALPDAAMSSQRAPLAGVVSAGTPPPLCLRNLFGKAKVRGSIVEAQFARLPIEKLTVQLS